MNSPSRSVPWLSPFDAPLLRPGARGLPEPRALLTWWLAVALLTWVQLRHDQLLPLAEPAWRGVIALALSITVVSSMAGRASLERVLLLIGAWAIATRGGSSALIPLASVSAAIVAAHAHETAGELAGVEGWRPRLGPCLLALCGLAAWNADITPTPTELDPAAPALAGIFLVSILVLAWIHRRQCQGPGGSIHAGPIAALSALAAALFGLVLGDTVQIVTMLLVMGLWLPLLLAAHLPPLNPTSWWFRRAAITVSACALGCWGSISLLPH